jgi:hypothetical protein
VRLRPAANDAQVRQRPLHLRGELLLGRGIGLRETALAGAESNEERLVFLHRVEGEVSPRLAVRKYARHLADGERLVEPCGILPGDRLYQNAEEMLELGHPPLAQEKPGIQFRMLTSAIQGKEGPCGSPLPSQDSWSV